MTLGNTLAATSCIDYEVIKNQVDVMLSNGHLDCALQYIEDAQKIHTHKGLPNIYVKVLYARGEYQKAIDVITAALEERPYVGWLYPKLAKAYVYGTAAGIISYTSARQKIVDLMGQAYTQVRDPEDVLSGLDFRQKQLNFVAGYYEQVVDSLSGGIENEKPGTRRDFRRASLYLAALTATNPRHANQRRVDFIDELWNTRHSEHARAIIRKSTEYLRLVNLG